MNKNLVIGRGQIGVAIASILACGAIDKHENIPEAETIHICFPYSETFIEDVLKYQIKTKTKYTIIHSTVPVGTSIKCNAVHSPCSGQHPNLEQGIRTFTKYFGGKDAEIVSKVFEEKGIKTSITDKQENTEAGKLWATTQYGWNIILEKEIHKYCEENNLDFDIVYTMFNTSYNAGYEKLGHPEYKMYILKHQEGKIGGHCVLPNLDLLHSPICNIIKKYNNSGRELSSAI